MMGEWKKYKLKDVCTILGDGLHGTPIYDDKGEFFFINGNNLKDGRISIKNDTKRVPYSEANKYKKPLNNRTILVSINGTIGNVAKYRDEKCILGKSACFFNVKENVDLNFIYYVVANQQFKNTITQLATGTTIKNVSLETMRNYTFCIPPLSIQKHIGKILSSFDAKIELNRRINDNLEQQAQALFKSWFVDFDPFKDGKFVESELGRIPEGWRVERLGSVCKCLLGGTPSRNKEEYWNGKIAWINSGEINEFRITKPSEYITQEGLKKSATKLLPKKTTVLAITGATLGQVSLLEINSCANQSVIGLLENEDIFHEYIYPLIKNRIDDLCSHMTGGAQQHINKNNVEQLEILIPPKKILVEYKQIATPIYSLISNICFESQKISKLRDSLLPRLMSGELKLDKINN
jgi:restriction modification system DNA specificity domain protein